MSTKREFQVSTEESERKMRRPPRPPEKLKAERVQEELKTMPGWALRTDGKALTSARQFANPAGAAKFAGFVADLAAAEQQPVHLGISGTRVFLSLTSRPGVGGLNKPVLDFARQLG
jgi:pterin-4a-carbinolamine dehydratase